MTKMTFPKNPNYKLAFGILNTWMMACILLLFLRYNLIFKPESQRCLVFLYVYTLF